MPFSPYMMNPERFSPSVASTLARRHPAPTRGSSYIAGITLSGSENSYEGHTAHSLVAAMGDRDGLITLSDLANYCPIKYAPVNVRYPAERTRWSLLADQALVQSGSCECFEYWKKRSTNSSVPLSAPVLSI